MLLKCDFICNKNVTFFLSPSFWWCMFPSIIYLPKDVIWKIYEKDNNILQDIILLVKLMRAIKIFLALNGTIIYRKALMQIQNTDILLNRILLWIFISLQQTLKYQFVDSGQNSCLTYTNREKERRKECIIQ